MNGSDPLVDDVLRAAVGHGLESSPNWPTALLPNPIFLEMFEIARQKRLLGVLAQAIVDESFRVTDDQRQSIADHHLQAQIYALRVETLLVKVACEFEQAGVDYRILKGVALARTVYADPAWRSAGDIDVLIPSHDFDKAVSIACADRLGGDVVIAELRPGFDREFGKESLVRIDGIELDIHRTFVAGPFGLTIDLDELFASKATFAVGDTALPTLSPTNQFLHACYNTALGDQPVRLGSVRDLLLCQHRLQIDLDEVLASADRWGGTAVVQRAAQLAIDAVGPACAAAFVPLATMPVPRRQKWMLASYLTTARSYTRALVSLAVIPGIRPRLRYARALMVPSEAYLRSRGLTKRAHVRRALRRLSGS